MNFRPQFSVLLPRVFLAITLLGVLWSAVPPRPPSGGPDFQAFGRIPVVSGGRIKPLDTVARNALLEISGRTVVRDTPGADGKAAEIGHLAWLAEVLFDGRAAARRPVVLVENEEVKAVFGKQGDEKQKRFPLEDIAPSMQKSSDLAAKAMEKPDGNRDVFERQVIALDNRVHVLGRLFHSVQPLGLEDYNGMIDGLPDLVARAVPETTKLQRGEAYDETVVAQLSSVLQAFQGVQNLHAFFAVPPKEPGGNLGAWRDAGSVVLDDVARGKPHPAIDHWARIADGYRAIPDDGGAAFNAATGAYRAWLAGQGFSGLGKAGMESWFNDFAPFYISLVLYVAVFLIILAAWLTGSPGLQSAAWQVLVLTLVVHTLGLAMRVWISGRPPVTNLYSSAVFIGWGTLLFCLALERAFLRNGIGGAAAALIGFATLLIAHHLSFEGDTLEVKRAVLDSNFWLATHVVVVTLGYSATYLAGFLAILWLALRFLNPVFFDIRARKAIAGAVYGTVCFALLFSFTGTVLGGIWADQSWGRFWGWDPKENGALLIVLWNAIILHARWGGMIRERGLMVLAMGGNIITSWSWFGTNMLGVGLHSYGFIDSAFKALLAFCLVQAALMAAAGFLRDGRDAPRNEPSTNP